tara:strand:+ start:5299 stop:6066 length:768 start_codon:yes stop_codon:yes gene_type:complete
MFIHVGKLNNYQGILDSIINSVRDSGLYNEVDKICIGAAGTGSISNLPDKCVVVTDGSNINAFERPTLTQLQNHCREFPEGYTLYTHTKNASLSIDDADPRRRDRWYFGEIHRKYMIYFMINKFRECIRVLDSGYTSVGCDFRNNPENSSHYAGNFWWVNNKFINTLPDISGKMFSISGPFGDHPRHYCERWLLCYNNKENSQPTPRYNCPFWGAILRKSINNTKRLHNMSVTELHAYFDQELKRQKQPGYIPII